jgi:hypothetical protein
LQNPNGIKTQNHSGKLLQNLQTCCSIGTGILCLPETNTNWSHQQNRVTFQKALKSVWNHSNYQLSSSNETFESNYQPGGIATVELDRWTSRVVTKGMDPFGLGRWSYITLRGSNNKLTTVITGYRVCISSPSTAGVKTAYMQQFYSTIFFHKPPPSIYLRPTSMGRRACAGRSSNYTLYRQQRRLGCF